MLWALQNKKGDAELTNALNQLVEQKALKKPRDNNPETWSLHDYIELAAHLGLIEKDTAIQARLAKDFRNLIHPGRSARVGMTCNRATALSAIAALEHIVQDLT